MVMGAVRMPHELNSDMRTLGSVDLSMAYNSSNQNNFDAARVRIPALLLQLYGELKVSPSFQAAGGAACARRVTVGPMTTWWSRRYPHRLTQDPSGV